MTRHPAASAPSRRGAALEEGIMQVTTTYVNRLEFPEGATVHFSNGEWLSLCGHGWIHSSNDPQEITCAGCIERLSEEALALMYGDSDWTFWERPGYVMGPAEEARYG